MSSSPRPRRRSYRLSAGGWLCQCSQNTLDQDIPPPRISAVSVPGVCCPMPSSPCSAPQARSSCCESRVRLPILHAALDGGLDQYPAHLVVDLARMTFCSVRGLDLLTQIGRIAAAAATGYAVAGVSPQIHRVWTLCWGSDRPIHYPSTAAAVLGIRAAESDVQVHRPRRALGNASRPEDFQLGRNGFGAGPYPAC
jgi:hypothetical protein